VFIFGEIFRMEGISPSLIRQGNKLYELSVKKRGQITATYFRDTYNIMPVRLSLLPKTFNLDVEEKKFFPHLYNRKENLRVRLPHLPPKEDYLCDAMKPKKRKEFIQWYEENKHEEFHLAEKLAEYCCSDVKILLWYFYKYR
jgi:hypothetical protein